MTESAKTKQLLTNLPLGGDCCCLAELGAIISGCGSLSLTANGLSIELASENKLLSARVDEILKRYFGSKTEDRGSFLQFEKKLYAFAIPSSVTDRVLAECGIAGRTEEGYVTITEGIAPHLIEEPCCKQAYLRGLFLGGGYLHLPASDSAKSGYLLEWVLSRQSVATDFHAVLSALDVAARMTERNGRYVVYTKDAQNISDALAHMGASKTVMNLQSVRADRMLRNRLTREVNCDQANIQRAVNAAQTAINAIRRIERARGLESLPDKLKSVAVLRLDHPEDSLEELANDAGLTKSCVRHRLDKLMTIASAIEQAEE